MSKNIEEEAANVALQDKIIINIKNANVQIDQPSLATLILASKFIAKLPNITMPKNNMLQETFAQAEGTDVLADILCVLILGAKNYNAPRRWWEFWNRKYSKETIRKKIYEELTINDLFSIALQIFKSMQIDGFFGLTTFLSTINLLKTTRKVENETTASGQ